MKTSSLKLAASLLVLTSALGTVGALTGGCAATPTRESTGEYVDDATITTKVKAALIKDPIVKAFEVSVTTFKGVVQLSGFVDNADQKMQAEKVAETVKGVKEVQNNISLR